MNSLLNRLMLGGSTIALATIAPFAANTVMAQGAASDAAIETVTVTGTSIRGTVPVGANLITIGPADIAATGGQTLEQVLVNVPSLSDTGAVGQGQVGVSYFQPSIHQLGANLSNTTLVIIDGHRAPTGGTNHQLTDPNIIPTNMIQQVDVLADGASSIYGSDATAGVINIITRSRFEGAQFSVQSSFMNGATDLTGGALIGSSWASGSAMVAFQTTHEGSLADKDRWFTNPNQTARGGTNFDSFSCSPASIQPNGSGSTYYLAAPTGGGYSATGVSSAAANSPCTTWAESTLVPTEVRDSAMLRIAQDFGSNFSLTSDLVYGDLRDTTISPPGSLTATVYSAGPQANPFYINPPGVTATKQVVRFSADGLLPDSSSVSGNDTAYGDLNAEYRLGDNFVIDGLALLGKSETFTNSYNTLNPSVAYLALNGTSQSGGSTTTPAIAGTTQIVNNYPLTTSNALDVWDPASSNKSTAAVIKSLTQNNSIQQENTGIEQFRLSTSGTVWDLPGGPLKVGFGIEEVNTNETQFLSDSNGTGSTANGSYQTILVNHRQVYSYYGELDIPIIGPDNAIPLVQKFELDVSGRYDDYSDVGVTTNPKFAFTWQALDWLRLRGNYNTSFVAPAIDVRGGIGFPSYYAENTFAGTTSNTNVPVANYPIVTSFGIAGCTAASVTCNISTLQGITNRDGDANAKPSKGRGWSVGFDLAPDFLPGFNMSFSLWHTSFLGGITGPSLASSVDSKSLNSTVTFYPNCATPAEIAALQGAIPQSGPLPPCAQYLFANSNSNYFNLRIQGIDANFNYKYDLGSWGTAKIGDNVTQYLSFTEAYGVEAQGVPFNILNTAGFNTGFPSVATQMRGNIGWILDGVEADLFVNFTSGYANWNGNSINPIILGAAGTPEIGNPIGGGDHVPAYISYDLHLSYAFSGGILGDDQITLTGRNILNETPPFYNSSAGYDAFISNALGRVIEIGLVAKY